MPGWELVGEEEKQAVCDVFDKGGVLYRYGLDARRQKIFRVDDFERELAKKVGAKHALMVCNGTAAVKLALFAAGVKPGDEVITQSFTFIATMEAILELGATPVVAEIDESLNMDPKSLERLITPKTKAIVPVHMAGVPARMKEILAIANAKKIPVVEDACQALGATYQGKWLGTLGTLGCYSTDVGKIITTGEGGILVTDDSKLWQKAREYSDHGHEVNPKLPRGRDTRTIWGFNYKATELHGAVGLAQLKKLDHILQAQRANKAKLKKAVTGVPGAKFRDLPDAAGDAGDTLIFFVESTERALKIAAKMAEKGVGTKNLPDAIDWHYAGTWTHMFGGTQEQLEKKWAQSTRLVRSAVSLPILVNMTDADIERIAGVVREACAS
jgi:8-amino-3,8-dideoxy-alpha-D-manno-octulosonate transaminase